MSSKNVTIFGDGISQSIIDVPNVSQSPQFLISNSNQAQLNFQQVGVWTNTNGIGVQFGAESFSDSLDFSVVDLHVQNFNTFCYRGSQIERRYCSQSDGVFSEGTARAVEF